MTLKIFSRRRAEPALSPADVQQLVRNYKNAQSRELRALQDKEDAKIDGGEAWSHENKEYDAAKAVYKECVAASQQAARELRQAGIKPKTVITENKVDSDSFFGGSPPPISRPQARPAVAAPESPRTVTENQANSRLVDQILRNRNLHEVGGLIFKLPERYLESLLQKVSNENFRDLPQGIRDTFYDSKALVRATAALHPDQAAKQIHQRSPEVHEAIIKRTDLLRDILNTARNKALLDEA